MNDELTQRYERALASLNEVLQDRPGIVHDDLEAATQSIVAVRDALLDAARHGATESKNALPQVNSLLSLIVSAEFPLVGLRWKRIESARDSLQELARRRS